MKHSPHSSAPRFAEPAAAILLFSLLIFVLRYPTSHLGLVFYDDGETLYHVMMLLSGYVPYRDDHTHHFLGYVLPVLVGAKVFGFSLELIRQMSFLTYLAAALGVFLCMRLISGFWLSVLAAAITVSIREPYVWAYFIQYQLNVLIAFILYFAMRYCLEPRRAFLLVSTALSSVAFCFDQRALALSFIPAAAFFLAPPSRIKERFSQAGAAAFVWAIFPGLAALYLLVHGAWDLFIEQTITFPRDYRVGSLSLSDILYRGYQNHLRLAFDAPIAVATACAGFAGLIRDRARWVDEYHDGNRRYRALYLLLLLTALPLAIMPLFGGRDFPNYVITWYPLMGMLAVLSIRFFRYLSERAARLYPLVPVAAVLISLAQAISYWNGPTELPYKGDGRAETVEYLRQNLSLGETVLVWAYRLDLYAALEEKAPYPIANRIMVHPDHLIVDREARIAHIYPPYEREYLRWLDEQPPTYIVTVDRTGYPRLYSPTDEKIHSMLETSYEQVFEISRRDFMDKDTTFRVYRQSEEVAVPAER